MKTTLSSLFALFTLSTVTAMAEPFINSFSDVPPAPKSAEGAVPRILKWQDGKKAVFLMAFDDSCNSHLDVAIPLLEKYKGVGTFYIISDSGQYKGNLARWKALDGNPCVVLGNHTWTHKGATSAENLDTELAKANEQIKEATSKQKWPRLISFGQPGGCPWTVSKDEVKAGWEKYHLVDRPPFWGAAIHVKTVEEARARVDKALKEGGVGHLDFHGVGGDWLAATADFFEGLLQKLVEEKETVWQTSHIDSHKYAVERDASTIKVVKESALSVQLALTSTADSAFYDLPLTVEAGVPAAWKRCKVAAGNLQPVTVDVVEGRIRFYALPGTITLTKAP